MSLIAPDAAQRVDLIGPDVLYKGWRAEALLGEDVYGPRGEQIGEVENILVGADGRITGIVVEGGGFLGIGDAAFRVPWNQVDVTAGQDGIKVSLTEERAETLGLFDGPNWVATGPREWRVSELIGDYARLRNGLGFGYVTDVVFGRDGRMLATLVNRDLAYGGGLYGYPFYGWNYGWDPGLDYYALPYETPELAAATPVLDYDRFDDGIF
jgi:sporulation protein YlmC with PRC-barrel domain